MASVDATLHDYKTYRVLGIDKTWDVEKLRVCLASQPGDIQPKVLSLAAETDKRSQMATVVFQNGRVLKSPIQPEDILIENTFHGITPLFTPPKEYHEVESGLSLKPHRSCAYPIVVLLLFQALVAMLSDLLNNGVVTTCG